MSKIALILMVSLLLLKVTGTVAMSWWWVLCPIWAPIAAVLLVFAVIGIFALLAFLGTLLVIGVMMLIEEVKS